MASATQSSTQTQALMVPQKLSFHVTDRHLLYDDRFQQVFLEADKECNDVQHYVTELMEYLKAELENNLDESDGPIIFTVSLDVTYSTQWEKFQNDDKSDPEEDDETYTLRSGNLFVEDRDHLIQKIVQAHIQLYDANEVYDCTERCLQAKSIKNVSCKVLVYGR